jgi:hypothetical protein
MPYSNYYLQLPYPTDNRTIRSAPFLERDKEYNPTISSNAIKADMTSYWSDLKTISPLCVQHSCKPIPTSPKLNTLAIDI